MNRSDRIAAVQQLSLAGHSIAEICRLTGIPHTTVHRWVTRGYPEEGRHAVAVACPRCGTRELDEPAYAYLLGLYLRDGTLVRFRNGTWRLEIFQDARYPRLIDTCDEAMAIVVARRVGRRSRSGCVVISCYSTHLPCLFPQAGPGKKHQRPIVLEPWQREIVERHPRQFLRGLMESDGNRHINVVKGRGGKTYRYARYMFSNRSDDIRDLFRWACDLVGVHWTTTNAWECAVSRRADVALLDTFIGPKS